VLKDNVMDNKEFGILLERRTLDFGIAVIRLSYKLPKNEEGKVLWNQLTKSGTSIGANYREADRSRSKSDFINKLGYVRVKPMRLFIGSR